jgi:hypothetical protein
MAARPRSPLLDRGGLPAAERPRRTERLRCTELLLKLAGPASLSRALQATARYGDSAGMQRLLALGAEPTPAALLAGAASEGLPAAGVSALLDRGVRDEQAMNWAARQGDTPVVAALKHAGVAAVVLPAHEAKRPATPRSVRSAIDASLPLLQHADTVFPNPAHLLPQQQPVPDDCRGAPQDSASTSRCASRWPGRAPTRDWRERELQDIPFRGRSTRRLSRRAGRCATA